MFGFGKSSTNNPENYYHREGETFLVEIKLNEVRQLFNSLDSSPFRKKDLDPEARDYIVDSVREFHLDSPVKLVFYLPEALCNSETEILFKDAIHNYFAYRTEITAKELRYSHQQGRRALVIGLLFLLFCLGAQQFIAALAQGGLLWLIAQEGFLITGWVAMWRAIDIFLYEAWSIRGKRRLYDKLAVIPVELRAA
jgi:hypothetical protein